MRLPGWLVDRTGSASAGNRQDPPAPAEIDGLERGSSMQGIDLLAVIISLLALLIAAVSFGQSLERRRRD